MKPPKDKQYIKVDSLENWFFEINLKLVRMARHGMNFSIEVLCRLDISIKMDEHFVVGRFIDTKWSYSRLEGSWRMKQQRKIYLKTELHAITKCKGFSTPFLNYDITNAVI